MRDAACPASADMHDTPEPSATERPTMGDIFRQYGPAYRAKYGRRMSRDQRRVLAAIAACGTGELGHVHYRCAACSRQHVVPRSCGNRHCPRCQGQKARQWLDTQVERLLPCPYFLVTVTVPAELRRFVRSHPRECYKALFDASSATLMELAANPKHVGSSQLGFTGVLHTWGRALDYHPHVHYVVPGGAIGADGQSWLPSRADFLVPVRAASILFRAKFRDAMNTLGLLQEIPPEVWAKAWIVHSQAVGDGQRALRYLAPYVFRVALGNSRIVKCEPGPGSDPLAARVTFTYRKSGSRRYRPMTVTAEEFIRRFLQHVLPRGFQKVRHFGFAHPRRKIDREWLRMLVTVTLNLVFVLTVGAQPPRQKPPPRCPDCGGPLEFLNFLPPPGRSCLSDPFDTS